MFQIWNCIRTELIRGEPLAECDGLRVACGGVGILIFARNERFALKGFRCAHFVEQRIRHAIFRDVESVWKRADETHLQAASGGEGGWRRQLENKSLNVVVELLKLKSHQALGAGEFVHVLTAFHEPFGLLKRELRIKQGGADFLCEIRLTTVRVQNFL